MEPVALSPEALLRRIGHMSSANVDLGRQLEHQAKEVSKLEEAGRGQQQLLSEFERRAERGRQSLVHEAEAQARSEVAESERALRMETEELQAQSQREREGLIERIRTCEVEARERQASRDEAVARAQELEEQLHSALQAPEVEARARALEMELDLIRSRLAREVAARQMAEGLTAQVRLQQAELRASHQQVVEEQRRLQHSLREKAELAAFRQETVDDLRSQMAEQRSDAAQRLKLERGKFEAITRLEGILPRHMLAQALA